MSWQRVSDLVAGKRDSRFREVLAAMVAAKRAKNQDAYDDAHWQMVQMLMGRDRQKDKDDDLLGCTASGD